MAAATPAADTTNTVGGAVPAAAPVFLSYSRKDFYFAESLALHLLKQQIPAWMDVRDLQPGVFWERDLFAALDAAACVIVIASRESMRSTNVGEEVERARRQNKRIIVVRFRGVHLPEALARCEQVDFRGAFSPALRELIERLRIPAPSQPRPVRQSRLFRLPLWVLTIVIILAIPTLAFMGLADWGSPSQDGWGMLVLVALFVLGLCWSVTLSFLQRRMGMTRLATSLAVLGGIFAFPLLLYRHGGAAALTGESVGLQQATMYHWNAMFVLAALPLLCVALIVVLRPDDLLRWTPTGKAWNWYRRKCSEKLCAVAREPARSADSFFLLHDAADIGAANCVRQDLFASGWQEGAAASSGKAVLLLTNRTRAEWLLQQQPLLAQDVMTVVATSICLPAQLEWLWKREWIDFREWQQEVLERREALQQVPEAVTQPRFSAVVRFANHLLCCLGGVAFWLMAAANPAAMRDSQTNAPPAQVLGLIAGFVVVVLCIELARRLLRRSVSAAGFYRGAWVGWGAALILAAAAWARGIRQPAALRFLPVVLFLLFFPIALARIRKALSFWFPATRLRKAEKAGTLATKRIWRTFWCVALYLMIWGWMLGLY